MRATPPAKAAATAANPTAMPRRWCGRRRLPTPSRCGVAVAGIMATMARPGTFWFTTRRHLPALGVAVGAGVPLVAMVAGSLRPPGRPPSRVIDLVPSAPTTLGYRQAFELVDLGRFLANSLMVVAIAVPLSVLCASWAGFAIAQLPRRSARWVVGLCVTALILPPTALIVGRFTLFGSLSVLDSFVPLIAPALYGTSALFVLFYAWSFRRLPSEYFDVGRLAGLSAFQIWRRIASPLVRPTTAVVATLAMVTTWGNVVDPLVYIQDPERYTLPLGLRVLQLVGRQDTAVQLAASVIATLPVVLAFLLAQRHFMGALRGMGRAAS